MPKGLSPNAQIAVGKRRLREMLHSQLDALLNGDTVEDGFTISVLDSMVKRAFAGYGFNVRVHSMEPSEAAAKREAPGTVEPGAQLGLAREDGPEGVPLRGVPQEPRRGRGWLRHLRRLPGKAINPRSRTPRSPQVSDLEQRIEELEAWRRRRGSGFYEWLLAVSWAAGICYWVLK